MPHNNVSVEVRREEAPDVFNPKMMNKAAFDVTEIISVRLVKGVEPPTLSPDELGPDSEHPHFLRVEALCKPGVNPDGALELAATVGPRLMRTVGVCDPDKLRLIPPEKWSEELTPNTLTIMRAVLANPAAWINAVEHLRRFESTSTLASGEDHRPTYRIVMEATQRGGYLPSASVYGRRFLTVNSQNWTDDEILAAHCRAFHRRASASATLSAGQAVSAGPQAAVMQREQEEYMRRFLNQYPQVAREASANGGLLAPPLGLGDKNLRGG